jgi:crotonobetainyl-CoA:carnitine CoA-transferase CaiB-like acyl-CoA transferase
MAGPLKGLKVLDLTRVLAGPWCGQTLADMGADVIKVERPNVGDDTRGWGPPFLKDGEGNQTTESAYYLCANRGKQSIAVDMTTPEGQAIIKKLIGEADILIENYKVGGLAKYGLDYISISAEFPSLIYCSITGFGQTGPRKNQAGYDFMIQAFGGLMSVTGSPDNQPQKVGVAVADITTGLYSAIAILGALHHRTATGKGQHIDMSLLDAQVALLANQNMNYLTTGTSPKRMGNSHPNIVPYRVFETRDSHVVISVGNDGQFTRFMEKLKRPELAEDPDYKTNQARVEHRVALIAILEPLVKQKTTAEWLALLEGALVPCGPVNTIGDALNDVQIKHRGLRVDLDHPTAGTVPLVGCPIKYSETTIEYNLAPPLRSEHRDEILTSHGYSEDEIVVLKEKGTVE